MAPTGAINRAPTPVDEIADLHLQGLYRKVRTLVPLSPTRALWKDREIILFSGNDYLGLSHHPRVIEATREALAKYGVGAGAARLISGTSDLHTRLEKALARFKGKDRALVFGSGYLANLGVLSGLAGEKDLILLDKLCHASLIDGARLSGATLRVFPHKNYERCEEILAKCRGAIHGAQGRDESRPYRRIILVTDSVFSMDGDLADLAALIRLREKFGALLVVDDAHGIGVFGQGGRGVADGEALEKIDVVTGTLSKALGVFGGFAAASGVLIDHLINFSRPFIFATAPPPALMAAALESLRVMEETPELREKLWENTEKVRRFFSQEGEGPIFPIPIGDEAEAVRISEALLEQGLLIPAVRYPTVPKGKARLRLTVSAAHTEEDLERLFEVLSSVIASPSAKIHGGGAKQSQIRDCFVGLRPPRNDEDAEVRHDE